jgi:uncharacterized protein
MNFKTFEALSDPQKSPVAEPSYIREPQGKLRRTASVKVWRKVGVGQSSVDKRGVFSVDYIKEGEIFEAAPIVIVPADEVKETSLIDYAFKVGTDEYAIAFGNASLYNHRNQPSAEWRVDLEKKVINFVALHDIEPGEEIFISYGKTYWQSRDVSAKVSPDSKTK